MGLTSKRIAKLLRRGEPGKHLDQRGLYLVVKSSTSAHWERRYQLDGREHYHGLGSAYVFGLKQARERSRRASELLADGIDPLARKREAKAERIAALAKSKTFGEVAQDYYTAYSPTWKHLKHVNQWRASILGLTFTGKPATPDYCRTLRALPVQTIDTPVILSVLKPIWQTKPETMGRIRARIAATLDYAKVLGFRQGDNPADVALISKALPTNGKAANHFAAIDYRGIPSFMGELRKREGSAARCLEFLVSTAARSAEAREARWSEIDFSEKVWRIPRERMKGGKEHVVPLADPVLDLLRGLPREDSNDFVFVGPRPATAISDLTLMTVMRRMGRTETVHGFRASFSTWASETTSFPNIVIEQALAHTVGSAVERAYRRGQLTERRRKLMEAWASYCSTISVVAQAGATVTPIRGRV